MLGEKILQWIVFLIKNRMFCQALDFSLAFFEAELGVNSSLEFSVKQTYQLRTSGDILKEGWWASNFPVCNGKVLCRKVRGCRVVVLLICGLKVPSLSGSRCRQETEIGFGGKLKAGWPQVMKTKLQEMGNIPWYATAASFTITLTWSIL